MNFEEKVKPLFIAGPCVIESQDVMDAVAQELVRLRTALGIQIYFKASFDKANRTSLHSYRGPGMEKGLQILRCQEPLPAASPDRYSRERTGRSRR